MALWHQLGFIDTFDIKFGNILISLNSSTCSFTNGEVDKLVPFHSGTQI